MISLKALSTFEPVLAEVGINFILYLCASSNPSLSWTFIVSVKSVLFPIRIKGSSSLASLKSKIQS
jgi:hypothetical protein